MKWGNGFRRLLKVLFVAGGIGGELINMGIWLLLRACSNMCVGPRDHDVVETLDGVAIR